MKNISLVSKITLGALLVCSSSLFGMELIHVASDTVEDTLKNSHFFGSAGVVSAYHQMDFNNPQLRFSLATGLAGAIANQSTSWIDKNEKLKASKSSRFLNVTFNTMCQCGTALGWLMYEAKNNSGNLFTWQTALASTYIGVTYISKLHRAGLLNTR